MFVSSTTLLCVYVFAFCWVDLRIIMDTHRCKLGRAIMKSPVSGILILYTFIAVWFVGGLTSFHLYLISTNQVSVSSVDAQISFIYNLCTSYRIQCSSNINNCRQLMRTSDTATIGKRIRITVDWSRISLRSCVQESPAPETTSGQK